MASKVPSKKAKEAAKQVADKVEINVETPEVIADVAEANDCAAEPNDSVLHYLKIYSDIESVYVGKNGRVYDAALFRKYMDNTAILYKNPYYKK